MITVRLRYGMHIDLAVYLYDALPAFGSWCQIIYGALMLRILLELRFGIILLANELERGTASASRRWPTATSLGPFSSSVGF